MKGKSRQKFTGSPQDFIMDPCPSSTLITLIAFPLKRNGKWEELSNLVTPEKVEILDTPKEKQNKLKG